MGYTPKFIQVATATEFSLRKTMECGQVFRFNDISHSKYLPKGMRERRDEINYLAYFVVSESRSCIVAQNIAEDNYHLEIAPHNGQSGLGYWLEYFGVNSTDSVEAYRACVQSGSAKLMEMFSCGNGIHILRQDPWEMLVSFIVSQRNNIPRIKTTINRLCKTVSNGKSVTSFGSQAFGETGVTDIVWTPFPTAEELHRFIRDDELGIDYGKLNDVGLGYRDNYVVSAAFQAVKSAKDAGMPSVAAYMNQIRHGAETGKIATELVRRNLESYFGVGPKVAQCAALFGFGCKDMFPVDVWMERALSLLGPEFDPSKLGRSAGLVQQYIYFYMLTHGRT